MTWNPSPVLFATDSFSMRWYGFLLATAVGIGYLWARRSLQRQQLADAHMDSLLLIGILCGALGARLVHVFFYEWAYYNLHPEDILKVWRGGLASHGALLGVTLAIWGWSKWISRFPVLKVTDAIAAPAALWGVFVRTGNFFNQEIYGHKTDLPWAVTFGRLHDNLPRHPTQLYEALAYAIICVIMGTLYAKNQRQQPANQHQPGWISGLFLVFIFTARILIEPTKVSLSSLEVGFMSMGQMLSLPFLLLGGWMVWKTHKPTA